MPKVEPVRRIPSLALVGILLAAIREGIAGLEFHELLRDGSADHGRSTGRYLVSGPFDTAIPRSTVFW